MASNFKDVEMVTTGPIFQKIIDLKNKNVAINGYPPNEVLSCILKTCKVYARMSPLLKASLVQELQIETNEMIAMCGDGANDCNALKVADVGISLSKSEASIAAPFTSNVENISSVPDLLRIGRCSLDLSYLIFKYMLVYSIMEYTSVIMLYFHTSSISDSQLLFIDFFCAAPMTLFLCSLDEKSKLEARYPSPSLLSRKILYSLLSQMLFQGLAVMSIFFMLKGQGFFQGNEKSGTIETGKLLSISLSDF